MSATGLKIGAFALLLSAAPPTLYAQKTPVKVTVVLPTKGNLERLCLQPGTIQAFESVRLSARTAGFLKSQSVDIGDRVKKGQVLAIIDAPELEAQFKLDQLGVRQAEARLLRSKGKAEVDVAQADIDAAKAKLDISKIRLEFATITAPFDGVITKRNFSPGDLIRSPDQQGATPLLTIDRVDLMRVVVAVPELDAVLAQPGDAASVEMDAYRDKKWVAKVSRIARALDPKNRTMRVELDLANPDGRLLSSMSANVTITLTKKDVMSVPDTCVLNDILAGGDVSYVYVVRDGRARRVNVLSGVHAETRIEILKGLTLTDRVILQPAGVADGAKVTTPNAKKE